MTSKKYIFLFSVVLLFLIIVFFYIFFSNRVNIEEFTAVDKLPQISPDYTDIVIPANIAPLNFLVKEKGKKYYVKIYSENGEAIKISNKKPKILIPIGRWKDMLSSNRGQKIFYDIYVQNNKSQWKKYDTFSNQIANEDIDGFLAYRLIKPLYRHWHNIGIYQRNLSNFSESVILHNKTLDQGCINCHTFYKNSPDDFIIHMRAGPGTGMLLTQNGKTVKVDTRTQLNNSHAAYVSWHPNKKMLAFSINKVTQFFHAIGENRDVIDHASDLFVYKIESNTVTTSPKIYGEERLETYPNWSPDGLFLYFCSAPKVIIEGSNPVDYKEIKYDLMRIGFDPEKETWGELETLLSAKETELSITQPRISPDGRFLVFCMAKYGNFPVLHPTSDLYLMDIKSGEYSKMNVNSNQSESYHSWAGNSRWIVFSSKRMDGLLARPHFSYIDDDGKAHKPFLLPQKDPEFYTTFFKTYNRPELITDPVKAKSYNLTKAAHNIEEVLKAKLDPDVAQFKPDLKSEEPAWKLGKNK